VKVSRVIPIATGFCPPCLLRLHSVRWVRVMVGWLGLTWLRLDDWLAASTTFWIPGSDDVPTGDFGPDDVGTGTGLELGADGMAHWIDRTSPSLRLDYLLDPSLYPPNIPLEIKKSVVLELFVVVCFGWLLRVRRRHLMHCPPFAAWQEAANIGLAD